jgi:hypothetical protein
MSLPRFATKRKMFLGLFLGKKVINSFCWLYYFVDMLKLISRGALKT